MPTFEGKSITGQEARDNYWSRVTPEKMENFIFSKTGRKLPVKFIVKQLVELNPGSVLDLGCGYSPILKALREAGVNSRYVGVDPIESMISHNEEEFALDENSEFRVGTIEDSGDEKFDVTLFVNVFGSFSREEAQENLARGFDHSDVVIATNLDKEKYDRLNKSTRKITYQALSREDYEEICPEGFTVEFTPLGRKHLGIVYKKEK